MEVFLDHDGVFGCAHFQKNLEIVTPLMLSFVVIFFTNQLPPLWPASLYSSTWQRPTCNASQVRQKSKPSEGPVASSKLLLNGFKKWLLPHVAYHFPSGDATVAQTIWILIQTKQNKTKQNKTAKILDLSPAQLTVSNSSQYSENSVSLFTQWLEPSSEYAWQYRGVRSGVGTVHVS